MKEINQVQKDTGSGQTIPPPILLEQMLEGVEGDLRVAIPYVLDGWHVYHAPTTGDLSVSMGVIHMVPTNETERRQFTQWFNAWKDRGHLVCVGQLLKEEPLTYIYSWRIPRV